MHKTPTHVVVDAGGVGYEVQISLFTWSAIQHLEEGTLFTYLKVAEDAFALYGFYEVAEKEVFLKLIGVAGVGAGTARIMLSSMKPAEVTQAIAQGNVRQLESIKGIGKKTAERLVLELREKMAAMGPHYENKNTPTAGNMVESDALNALMALGIARGAAENALQKAMAAAGNGPQNVEALIKQALKAL